MRLNIVGDGPMRQKLEGQAAELKLTDRVNFLGEVADDELPGLYQSASFHTAGKLSGRGFRTVC